MRLSIFFLLLLCYNKLSAQVDISKYASDDLFKVNTVVTGASIESELNNLESNFELDLEKGFEFLGKQELDDALDHFLRMDEKYDQTANLKYYVGLVYFQRSELVESLEYMQEAFKIEPLFLEPLYYISLINAQNNNFKDAKVTINRLVEVPKYAALGYYGKAIISRMEGEFNRSIKLYKQCLEIDSTFHDAYIPLIELEMYYRRDLKSAFLHANQAVALNGDWEQAVIIRGMLSVMINKDNHQIYKDIEHLLNLNPNNYHYHYLSGFLNAELEKYEDAVNEFKTGLNLELDTVYFGSYYFSTKVKKYRTLRNVINYFLDHYYEYDSDSKRLINQSICSFFANNNDQAITYLDSLTSEPPTISESLLRGAIFGSIRDEKKKAIIALTDAITLDSGISFAFEERAILLQELGEYNLAYSDFSMLTKLKPRDKLGYKSRGMLKYVQKDYYQAYKDFSFAYAIDPTDYDLLYNRASASFYLKKYTNALFDLNEVVQNNGVDHRAYYMSYLCYLNTGDSVNALKSIDKASQLENYMDDYHHELIAIAEALNNSDLQVEGWSRLIKYRSRTKVYRVERAKVYIKQGCFHDALVDLRHYLKYEEKSGEAYYYFKPSI